MIQVNKEMKPPINPIVPFNKEQLTHRDKIYKAILDDVLKFEPSICFCGEQESHALINYDAWGFNIPTVICKKCFAIRSKIFLDEPSLINFYKDEYYIEHMFTYNTKEGGIGMRLADYFIEEKSKSSFIYEWLQSSIDLKSVKTILEVGCALGGVLSKFTEAGFSTFGCDYKKEYIEEGQKQQPGATLKCGGLEVYEGKKFDLIILSDFVEHLIEPVSFFKNLRHLLHENSLIYINVPGFMGISPSRWNCSIREYTKIEHTWCHTLNSLTYLMNICGFNYVTGDQSVRGVYQLASKDHPLVISEPSFIYKIKLIWFILTLPIKRILPINLLRRQLGRIKFVRHIYHQFQGRIEGLHKTGQQL